MKLLSVLALLPITVAANILSAAECMGTEQNKGYYLRFIQSALPTMSECDIDLVADNSKAFARDLVGLFRIVSDKQIAGELDERNTISDQRLGLISNQVSQPNLSGDYRFKRYFVPEGEIIIYVFSSGERYVLAVEF